METNAAAEAYQYVGPFRLEKTLGKGQTGEFLIYFNVFYSLLRVLIYFNDLMCNSFQMKKDIFFVNDTILVLVVI